MRDSDILPDVVGSDHCPVYVDLYDEIEIEGRGKVSLWDEMNPGRQRDDPLPDPPAFAARNYDEFSGKQRLMSNFFGKKVEGSSTQSPPVASPAPRSLSTPSTSARDTPVASTSKLASTAPSSSAPNGNSSAAPSSSAAKGKGKATELEKEKVAPGGQQSISNFFKPPPKPKPPVKKKKAKKAVPAPQSETTSIASQGSTSSSIIDLTDESDERMGSMDPGDYEAASSGSSAASSSSSAWSSLFAQKALPNCDGHGEPSKAWTVNKPGINKGRRFYLCARCLFRCFRSVASDAELCATGPLDPATTRDRRSFTLIPSFAATSFSVRLGFRAFAGGDR